MSVRSILHAAEKKFDHSKRAIKKKFNLFDPIMIYPYHCYAGEDKLHIMARVMEKEGFLHTQHAPENLFQKLWYMYRRYESDEIPSAEVEIEVDGKVHTVKADDEGFINEMISLQKPFNTDETNWHSVKMTLKDNPYTDQTDIISDAEIMVADHKANFGIISDVDDTIIQSFATSTYLKLKTLLLNTAKARIPFEGVPDFYRALQTSKGTFNPLFFISGSSWNIFDLLKRFCEDKEIPKAPFFLRELGIDSNMFIKKETREYKKENIRHLLDFYPDLSFLCIGDSGQKDPEIYGDIAKENPGRIKAIYIRKINKHKISDKRKQLQKELEEQKVPLLFIEDTKEAFEHAQEEGFV